MFVLSIACADLSTFWRVDWEWNPSGLWDYPALRVSTSDPMSSPRGYVRLVADQCLQYLTLNYCIFS